MAASSKTLRGGEMISEDLVFQILLQLPVRSLLRFKLVCKSWLSLIESSSFISKHTQRSNSEDNQENKLIILNGICRPHYCLYISVINFQLSNQVDFKANTDDKICAVMLIASFDGIVCLEHEIRRNGPNRKWNIEDRMFIVSLWNPATKHVKVLPPPLTDTNVVPRLSYYVVSHGFGFDVKTNDYKVVRVIVELAWPESNKWLKSHAEVYSLNTDSWRVIDAIMPRNIRIHSTPKRPFQNGICCWLGRDFDSDELVVLSFDFSKEVFSIIPMNEVIRIHNGDHILGFLRGKLACIQWGLESSESEDFCCKVWALDKCGVQESWTKLYAFICPPLIYPVGFSVIGKIVLMIKKTDYEERLALFDPASQEFSFIPYHEGSFYDNAVYHESLVSVKGANGETYRADSKWTATSTWDLTVSQMILRSDKKLAEIFDGDAGSLVIFDEPKTGISSKHS